MHEEKISQFHRIVDPLKIWSTSNFSFDCTRHVEDKRPPARSAPKPTKEPATGLERKRYYIGVAGMISLPHLCARKHIYIWSNCIPTLKICRHWLSNLEHSHVYIASYCYVQSRPPSEMCRRELMSSIYISAILTSLEHYFISFPSEN